MDQFAHIDKAFRPFYDTSVLFYGDRAHARTVAVSVRAMVVEDSAVALGASVVPTRERAFSIAFPRAAWLDPTPPNVGEWACFTWAGEEVRAKVASVARMPDGDFALSAVWNPNEKGGPQWLM